MWGVGEGEDGERRLLLTTRKCVWVGEEVGGPLPLSSVSFLEMDEEDMFWGGSSAPTGGGLEEGQLGRPLRLREDVI